MKQSVTTLFPDGVTATSNFGPDAQHTMWRSNDTLRVLAACMGAIALSIQFTDYGPLIPILEHGLQITPGQAGLLSSLLFFGLIMACLPAGWLADRVGQRSVLLGSLLLMIGGGALLPLWPNIYWILVCRALIGFGSGAAFIAGAGVVAGVEHHAALAQGLYGGFVQIGSGLGLLVTPLLAARLGWQGAFLVWGVTGIPALVAWLCASADQRPENTPRGEQPRAVAAGARSSAIWALGISHMGTFGTSSVLAAWISVFLVRQYGVSLSLAATFGALGLISGALIRPLGGLLLSKKIMSAVPLIRMGTCGTCLGMAVLALPWRMPALAIFGITAVAVGSTLPFAAVFDSAAHLHTVRKGVAQGLTSMIAWQSLLWAPPLVGVLLQVTGSFTLPFGILVLMGTCAISASFLVGPAMLREEKSTQAGPIGAKG